VSQIFDISSPTGVLEESGIGHVLISDLEIWMEFEARNTHRLSYSQPSLQLRNIYLRAS
jgi:hypothetical protein